MQPGCVRRLEHASEVHQRAAQSVDLVDDYAIHLAGFDVRQQLLERRTIHIATSETTVVITIGHAMPAFLRLAFDVRFGAFALGVKRVELLVETLVRRLASVDGTVQLAIDVGLVHLSPPFLLSLKKWYPLQCWPVIFLATALSVL